MSSKDNTDNADIPDIDIPTWFELHLLPYNYVIVTKLYMIGKYLCVEDLKLFKPHHIEALSGDEDSIVMLRAELAWEDLGGRDPITNIIITAPHIHIRTSSLQV